MYFVIWFTNVATNRLSKKLPRLREQTGQQASWKDRLLWSTDVGYGFGYPYPLSSTILNISTHPVSRKWHFAKCLPFPCYKQVYPHFLSNCSLKRMDQIRFHGYDSQEARIIG